MYQLFDPLLLILVQDSLPKNTKKNQSGKIRKVLNQHSGIQRTCTVANFLRSPMLKVIC